MVELDRSQMTTKYGAEKMQFACWIPKGDTHTHVLYVILIVFHGNSSYVNAPQCYVFMNVVPLVDLDSGERGVARFMPGCFNPDARSVSTYRM